METCFAAQEPQRGNRGPALQSHVTENASAKMPTAHGGRQEENAQAVVEAQPHVIGQAAACGQVAPMVNGAKAPVQASGLPEGDCADTIRSADSHDHSAGHWETGAHAPHEADLPATHGRARDRRFATPARPKPPTDEQFPRGDVSYTAAHDDSLCPHGTV